MKVSAIAAVLLLASCSAPVEYTAAPQRDASAGAKQYGSAERGQAIVGMWCVGCHSVGTTTNDRIPSLRVLAANPARTDAAIRVFLMQPHKPMPPLELGTQQIEDIIAYLRALPPPAPAR